MPELPEVESVRRGLLSLCGRRIVGFDRGVHDVVRGDTPLLDGDELAAIERHGKQLALVGRDGAVCVHLGMSGTLSLVDCRVPHPSHTHAVWRLEGGRELRFRDPRRFGGVWGFASMAELHRQRWALFGPDALSVGPATLGRRLAGARTPLKAALLDQRRLAGLGNIYVDELLYAARLSPWRPAGDLTRRELTSLVRRMRTLLGRAITAGGSTLRDYRDATGGKGRFQLGHRAYGRSGECCRRRGCLATIERHVLAGRSTHLCPRCQRDSDGEE